MNRLLRECTTPPASPSTHTRVCARMTCARTKRGHRGLRFRSVAEVLGPATVVGHLPIALRESGAGIGRPAVPAIAGDGARARARRLCTVGAVSGATAQAHPIQFCASQLRIVAGSNTTSLTSQAAAAARQSHRAATVLHCRSPHTRPSGNGTHEMLACRCGHCAKVADRHFSRVVGKWARSNSSNSTLIAPKQTGA